VPARNSPRGRARSRKRRSGAQQGRNNAPAVPGGQAAAEGSAGGAQAGSVRAAPRATRTTPRSRKAPVHSESALYSPRGVGERPQVPWHPLPLSELLILVGAIGAAIGFSRGVSHGAAPMFAGL